MNNLKITNDIETIVNNINSLTKDNLKIFIPMVEDIISRNSKDVKEIETLLDRLLDCCFNDKVLVLYKKLCRYYFYIDSEAAKDYVRYYFEIYEEDDIDEN